MTTIEEGLATGVSFALTDEQRSLRELARNFATKEIRPHEHACDEAMRHPAEVIANAHGVGLMNLHVPEEYGGPCPSGLHRMLVRGGLYWGGSCFGTAVSPDEP